jgi:hypothetical protein
MLNFEMFCWYWSRWSAVYQHIEGLRRSPQQLAVLNGRPTFLLHRPDDELWKVAPQLLRHVFIEENALHAI